MTAMENCRRIPISPAEAIALQNRLRALVRVADEFGPVGTVAGIDVGYDIKNNLSKAALVVLDMETLMPQVSLIATAPTPFPYIPGLLSFREAPVILKALAQLARMPDMLRIDGQGIAHPRRLGIAAHIGVITDIPAIGVAKSALCGHYTEPETEKGASRPLIHKGEKIGTAYRSRTGVKPVFISPGHRISHQSAVTLVEQCLTRYRLPEPTRLADKLSKTTAAPLRP